MKTKKLFFTTAILIIIIIISLLTCSKHKYGITNYTGFIELPFPSNAYTSGQIIEVYSDPQKIEITYDPKIPWDQANVSEGWDISAYQKENLKTSFTNEIANILKSTKGYSASQKVNVEFTDTKTLIIPKNRIFNALDTNIQKDPNLKRLLESYIENGTHFDVITQTLSTTISLTSTDESNKIIDIDSEVIDKLNSDFDLSFKRDSNSKKIISGNNLIVGIHYDPKMIGILLK